MPTVQIWLTGGSIVSNTVQVYSNPTTPINHGTFITTVTKNCLTINKPCEITIPDGTIKVRLLDFASYCYWDIPICDTNVCTNCGLTFSNVTNPNIGKLSVGNLIGSCDNSIDNYWVDWYGPNDSNLFSFSSGKGTQFPGWTNQFPLIGSTSPPLLPGNYVGKIRYIELNGVNFSYPSTSGFVYSSTLPNCSITQTVTSLSCSNVTGNNPYYNHDISYIGNNPNGGVPAPLETYFTLNNNQTSFAYSFTAENLPDRLTLTLVRPNGSQYLLENIWQGNGYSINLCPTTVTKEFGTPSEMKRVLNLTPFNITSSDVIKIQVQPNNAPLTNWNVKLTCPPALTYEKNCFNQYRNQSYKIKLSSIIVTSQPTDCNYTVVMKILGCNSTNTTGFDNSNYKNYVNGWSNDNASWSGGISDDKLFQINKAFRYYSTSSSYIGSSCRPLSQSPYTIQKYNTPGSERIVWTFTNTVDANLLFNEITTIKNNLTYNPNNTNINYYKYISISWPDNTPAQSPCAQENYNSTYRYVHCSTEITLSPNQLVLTVTTPIATYNSSVITQPPAGYCLSTNIESNLTSSNIFATGSTFTINSVYGIANSPTFKAMNTTTYDTTPTVPADSTTYSGYIRGGNNTYQTSSYPMLLPGNTLVTSLTAQTASFSDFIIVNNPNHLCYGYYIQTFYRFKLRWETITPTLRYTIWAKEVVNYGENIDNDTIRPWISVYDSATPGTYNPTYITP